MLPFGSFFVLDGGAADRKPPVESVLSGTALIFGGPMSAFAGLCDESLPKSAATKCTVLGVAFSTPDIDQLFVVDRVVEDDVDCLLFVAVEIELTLLDKNEPTDTVGDVLLVRGDLFAAKRRNFMSGTLVLLGLLVTLPTAGSFVTLAANVLDAMIASTRDPPLRMRDGGIRTMAALPPVTMALGLAFGRATDTLGGKTSADDNAVPATLALLN